MTTTSTPTQDDGGRVLGRYEQLAVDEARNRSALINKAREEELHGDD